MATWDDVRRLALGLPETTERPWYGMAAWRVRDKPFCWERPLSEAERDAWGERAPDGPILGVRVPDQGAKEALLADESEVYFTTAHFDGYPVVLSRLDRLDPAELEELVVEAWLDRAPKRLARDYLGGEQPGGRR